MSIRRTRRTISAGTALGLTLAALAGGVAVAPTASAKGLEVRTAGTCAPGTWKLKAKQDNSRIQVEFELDTNRVGQTYRVELTDNLVTVFSGTRVTTAPSGSFGVSRLITNRAGSDVIRATARNVATGAVCRAALTYTG